MIAIEPCEQAFEGEFAARHLHALDQIGGSGEEHAVSVLDQGEADGRGEMAFPGAGRAEDQTVGALGKRYVGRRIGSVPTGRRSD